MGSTSLVRKFVVGAALALLPAASFAGVFVSVGLRRRCCRCIRSRSAQAMDICGIQATGRMAMRDITGFRVCGFVRRRLGCCGRRVTGDGAVALYVFHAGYWGPHVGFYGGVNYGFGYGGAGSDGGRWEGGRFAYNTAVVNVNRTVIHNATIDSTVINHNAINSRTSFNGGTGGIAGACLSSAGGFVCAGESHCRQRRNNRIMCRWLGRDRSNFASVNGGHPQNAAIPEWERARESAAANRPGGAVGPDDGGRDRNVEHREASIIHQAATTARRTADRLTAQEHQQINQRQNNVSRFYQQISTMRTRRHIRMLRHANHGNSFSTITEWPADIFAGHFSRLEW